MDKNILVKIKDDVHKNGRPKLRVTFNPALYSALITKEDGYFVVTYINLFGLRVIIVHTHVEMSFNTPNDTYTLYKTQQLSSIPN